MRIFHPNESFLLASFLPPKKRGNRERGWVLTGHSTVQKNNITIGVISGMFKISPVFPTLTEAKPLVTEDINGH